MPASSSGLRPSAASNATSSMGQLGGWDATRSVTQAFGNRGPSKIFNSSFMRLGYRVANPTQFIVKTGMGVRGMRVTKNTLQLPFQTCMVVDMNPRNYQFNLNNMSSELVPFNLPVVFTIGPVDPEVDLEGFKRYATKLSALTGDQITSIIGGMIQGETRILSAHMTIREMFDDRDKFRAGITDRVQKDLGAFGLKIYNANIAEMHDLDAENKYFENLKRKALEGANTEARIQVAEARKLGDIGEQERVGDTKVETAKIEAAVKVRLEDANSKARIEVAEAKKQGDIGERQRAGDTAIETARINAGVAVQENVRRQEVLMSDAQREVVRVQAHFTKEAAELEAAKKKAVLETELQQELGRAEAERLRATLLAQAEVDAAATRIAADAQLYCEQRKADATLAHMQAQATGLSAVLQAGALQPSLACFYLGLHEGLFEKLAAHSAAAIQGLQPKINVWDTAAGKGGADAVSPIRNLFTAMPPMLDVLAQQTNVQLPAFMPQCAPQA